MTRFRYTVVVDVDPDVWQEEYGADETLRESVRQSIHVAVENAGTGEAHLTVREIR